jgi:hypothetical protein
MLALLFYGAYWCIIRYLVSPEDVFALKTSSLVIATGFLISYIYLMYRIEKPYLKNVRLPLVGRLVR